MKGSPQPATRRRSDAAFRALNVNPELLYQWQKEALTPVARMMRRWELRSSKGFCTCAYWAALRAAGSNTA